MFKIVNFTRPYLPDVLSFSSFLFGGDPLSEENWEHFIGNDEQFCKIALDPLEETLGYMACNIVEPNFINSYVVPVITGQVGVIYHASIIEEWYDNGIDNLLINQCVDEFNSKSITTIYCVVEKDADILVSFKKVGFEPIGTVDNQVILMKA